MPISRTSYALTLLLVAAALDTASAETPAKLAIQSPPANQQASTVAAPDIGSGNANATDRAGDRNKGDRAAATGNHYDGDGGADGLGGTYNGGGNDVP